MHGFAYRVCAPTYRRDARLACVALDLEMIRASTDSVGLFEGEFDLVGYMGAAVERLQCLDG